MSPFFLSLPPSSLLISSRLCERVPSNGEKENATTTFEPGRGALKEPESGGLFGEQRPRSSSAVGGGTTVQLIRIPLTNRKPVKFRWALNIVNVLFGWALNRLVQVAIKWN